MRTRCWHRRRILDTVVQRCGERSRELRRANAESLSRVVLNLGSKETEPSAQAAAPTATESLCLVHGVCLGGGQRALESGPVGRPAVRRKHVLDRQLEERSQPLGDLLARDAGAEPTSR